MVNTTQQACTTRGWAGVSYVGHGNGTQIGAPARRVNGGHVQTVVLKPGGRAVAVLQEVNAMNFPNSACHPVHADGLRVYPPNQTASAYVPHPTTACAKATAKLLSVTPFTAGS